MKYLGRALIAGIAIVGGGYLVADAWDVVPGFLTVKSQVEEPESFPSVADVEAKTYSLPTYDSAAKAPNPDAVAQVIKAFGEDYRVTGDISMLVYDAETGDQLGSLNPSRGTLPASNMKIVTAAAALEGLGPDTTFPTTTELDGSALYLVGGGDVWLAPNGAETITGLPRAGMKDLADATAAKLKAEGVSSVSVTVDATLFAAPLFHVDNVGVNSTYVMQMRPIALERSRWQGGGYTNNPHLSAAQVFADHLAEAGIEVTGIDSGAAPSSAKEISRIESAPVREIVDFMLVNSDNTTAEVLAHLLAVKQGRPASFTGAAAAVTEQMENEGYPMSNVVISDSSGLVDSNRITAALLVEILKRTWQCDGCDLAAMSAGFPVGGLDGTLWDRFHDTEIEGQVRAKTGTLIQANSLSGFLVTDAGRPLIFSIMIDNIEEGTTASARPAIDDVLQEIAKL